MNRKRLFPAALLPLAILPAIIATACSTSNSSDTKAQVNQEVTRLNQLIKSNKLRLSNPMLTSAQITKLQTSPNDLLDLLDQSELALNKSDFKYEITSLTGLEAAALATAKTMHFKFQVSLKDDQTQQPSLSDSASVAYQVQSEAVQQNKHKIS